MRIFSLILAAGLLFSACGTQKQAASKPAAVASASDYPHIQKFHEGLRYKSKGQYDEAITTFQECLALQPDDDASAFALAQCYLITKRRSQAITYTEMAAKLDPENIWYTQELAYMYFEEGKLDQAEKAFQKMVAAQPQNIDWIFGYAEVLKRQGKPQQAIDAYNRMEDQLGSLPDLALQKYDLYVRMKQDARALSELEKARQVYPDDPNLLGALVDHYFQRNDLQKAKDILLEMVRINPANGQAHVALGDIYMRENNKAEAYPHFDAAFRDDAVRMEVKMSVLKTFYDQPGAPESEVIGLAKTLAEANPSDANAQSVYGDILLKAGRDEEALQAYKAALQRSGSEFAVWNQVLMMEYRMQRFEDLYRDARACAALFPTLPNVQILYAIASVQTGRYQEAIDASEVGLSLVVNDKVSEAEFYAQMGEAYFKLKKPAEARDSFDKALGLDPQNIFTKNNYAMMLASYSTDFVKANQLIDEVLVQYPREANYVDTKGFILFREGKYPQARTEFEVAIELSPETAAFTEHLGDVYARTGDTKKALELWNAARAMDKKNNPTLDRKIQTKAYHDPL
jgi:tetratricopeptide (TPR) repeat protein